jgi:hypothetical protein
MNLPRRVLRLLTRPAREWPAIASESADVGTLYREYVAILAAIPAASILVGLLLAAGLALGTTALTTAFMAAMATYAMALAVPYAAAVAIEHLAPRFKSDGGTDEALALLAYSSTPLWLAGLFYIFVALSPLVLAGIVYAVYLFFMGLTPMLNTPPEQRVPFTLVAVLTVVVLHIVLGTVASLAGIPYYGF